MVVVAVFFLLTLFQWNGLHGFSFPILRHIGKFANSLITIQVDSNANLKQTIEMSAKLVFSSPLKKFFLRCYGLKAYLVKKTAVSAPCRILQ